MYKLFIFIVPEFLLKAIPDYPIFYHTGKNIGKLFI